jgi:flagellar L-ring protein precursor FlgH
MWVTGEQLVEINDETQRIRLEGRVRPQDITENNSVLSSRLSDAKISYVGDGVLAERQKPGWLARLLIWLGL